MVRKRKKRDLEASRKRGDRLLSLSSAWERAQKRRRKKGSYTLRGGKPVQHLGENPSPFRKTVFDQRRAVHRGREIVGQEGRVHLFQKSTHLIPLPRRGRTSRGRRRGDFSRKKTRNSSVLLEMCKMVSSRRRGEIEAQNLDGGGGKKKNLPTEKKRKAQEEKGFFKFPARKASSVLPARSRKSERSLVGRGRRRFFVKGKGKNGA